MNDTQRLTQMKKEYDALKVEHGVAVNEYNKLKKQLLEEEGVKNLKDIDALLVKLNKELEKLETRKDEQFNQISSKLQEFKRG